MYLDSSAPLIVTLAEALPAGDAGAARQAAHALKSSSANIGGRTASEHFRALEALVKEDPSDRLTLRALVKELEGQGRLLEARQVERLMDQGQKPEAEPDEPEVPER